MLIWKDSDQNELKSILFRLSQLDNLIEIIWISHIFRIWPVSCWKICFNFNKTTLSLLVYLWNIFNSAIRMNISFPSHSRHFTFQIKKLFVGEKKIFARNYWSEMRINKPKWFVFQFLCSAVVGIKCVKQLNALFHCCIDVVCRKQPCILITLNRPICWLFIATTPKKAHKYCDRIESFKCHWIMFAPHLYRQWSFDAG